MAQLTLCNFSQVYAQNEELLIQIGHTDRIQCMALSPDKQFAVTGSMDQTIKLWDLRSGFLIRTFKGHKGLVYDIEFSQDNHHFYSCSWDDRSVRKWHINQDSAIVVTHFTGDGASHLEVSCDDKFIYLASSDRLTKLSSTNLQKLEERELNELSSIEVDCHQKLIFLTENNYQKGRLGMIDDGQLTKITWMDLPCSPKMITSSPRSVYISDGKNVWSVDPVKQSIAQIIETHPVSITALKASGNGELIIGCEDGTLLKWSDHKLNSFNFQHLAGINDLIVIPGEEQAISVSNDQQIIFWDLVDRQKVKSIYSKPNLVYDGFLSGKEDQFIISSGTSFSGGIVSAWDLNKGKAIKAGLKTEDRDVLRQLVLTKDRSNIAGVGTSGKMYWSKFPSGTPSFVQYVDGEKATDLVLAKSGKSVVYSTNTGKLVSWRPDRHKKEEIQLTEQAIECITYTPTYRYLVAGTENGSVILFNDLNKQVIWEKETHGSGSNYFDKSYMVSYGSKFKVGIESDGSMFISGVSISSVAVHDSLFVVSCGGNRISRIEFSDAALKWQSTQAGAGFASVAISKDGKFIAAAGADGIVYLFDASSGKKINEFRGHQGEVRSVYFYQNDTKLISSGLDAQTLIWNLSDASDRIAMLISNNGQDYLLYNSKGFYTGTKGASSIVSFRISNHILPFAQFDLIANRPDLILKKFNAYSPESLSDYHKAYEKRLKRMNFQSELLKPDFHTPQIKISNSRQIPITTRLDHIILSVTSNDDRHKLDRLNVWVNNNPIYGVNGIPLRARQLNSIDTTIRIQLNSGLNKIEISTLNQAGNESNTEFQYITSSSQTPKPTLYFIGVGVKNYKDTSMNLKFSDKDIRDIAKLFASNENFDHVIIDTFLNSSVSTSILPHIKQKLSQSSIHDQVILMYSGHGILDSELNYFLTTHNINFAKPAEEGISFEDFNDLLDGIPARKKLMLIDACHSGEVDKEESTIESTQIDGVQSFELGKGDLFKQVKSTGNSFEMMQELFSDLRRGTGATVISSSAGKYYSYEDKQFQNGVYTYALKLALSGAADSNNDSEVSVNELKNYLQQKVSELTNGKQKPTTRQENLEIDWRVW